MTLPKRRDLPKTKNRAVELQTSTHSLFISLFTYDQRLLKPTDLPEWRLPKLDDCPKLKVWLFGYNQKFDTITRVEGCIAGAPTCYEWNQFIVGKF